MLLWMAAIKRGRVIKVGGCLWSVDELIPEGRTSKWETAQLGATLS